MRDTEDLMKISEAETGGRRSVFLLLAIYTGLFAVLACAVYFLFIYQGRTFLRFGFTNKDSFSQRYMFLFEFRRFIENLFAGGTLNTWDWSIGLGADGYSFNIANMVNPFMYMAAFAPEKYIDVAYSLTIVARVYLSGFTCLLFARKLGMSDFHTVLGAMMYAFSPWIILNSVAQGTFIMATLMFPLVLLGEEKILRGESPLLFILSVAYTVLSQFMFSYMIALIVLLYFLVRYLTGPWEKSFKGFLGRTGMLMISGISGIMISGAGLIVTLMKFGNSTATTGKTIPTLFSMTEYLRTPMKLVDLTTLFGSASNIGVLPLGIIMIPVIIYCFFKLKTNAVMTGILLVLAMIPFVDSVFNFFSYISGRWMFAIALFYALAAAEAFDDRYLKNRWLRVSMAAVFVIYCAYLAWITKILTDTGRQIVLANMAGAFIALLVILVMYFGEGEKLERSRTFRTVMTCAVCVAIALGGVTAYNLRFFKTGKGFLEAGEADRMIDASAQRIGQMIKDDDFYRVDQVGDLIGKLDPHCKVNEAMYYGNRSNYVFCSSVDNDWLIYNRLLGNNQGYYKRVAPNSNDDRFGLDYLQSVRYFIGDDVGSGAKFDSTPYAAYGFDEEDQKLVDGVELMTNRYSMGLGSMFDKYMRESEWLELSYPDREIAMLRAIVIPDDQDAPKGMTEIRGEDVETGVEEIEYTKKITTEKGDKFILSAENDDKHQIMVTFKNIRTSENSRMTVRVNNGTVKKTAINTINDERGFSDIDDITFNLGSGSDAAKEIKVHLIANGGNKDRVTFKYDDIIIWKVPLSAYDKAVRERRKERFELTSFENDKISGKVECSKSGVLYLSVPDDDGWTVKVDGNKVDKREHVDIAFMGIDLESGAHEIELEYRTKGILLGVIVTVLGLVLMAVILIVRRRKVSD